MRHEQVWPQDTPPQRAGRHVRRASIEQRPHDNLPVRRDRHRPLRGIRHRPAIARVPRGRARFGSGQRRDRRRRAHEDQSARTVHVEFKQPRVLARRQGTAIEPVGKPMHGAGNAIVGEVPAARRYQRVRQAATGVAKRAHRARCVPHDEHAGRDQVERCEVAAARNVLVVAGKLPGATEDTVAFLVGVAARHRSRATLRAQGTRAERPTAGTPCSVAGRARDRYWLRPRRQIPATAFRGRRSAQARRHRCPGGGARWTRSCDRSGHGRARRSSRLSARRWPGTPGARSPRPRTHTRRRLCADWRFPGRDTTRPGAAARARGVRAARRPGSRRAPRTPSPGTAATPPASLPWSGNRTARCRATASRSRRPWPRWCRSGRTGATR